MQVKTQRILLYGGSQVKATCFGLYLF